MDSAKLNKLYVPRLVSFIALLAIILIVGAVFFRVMAQFMVPLFLACVLLIIFKPLHRWLLGIMPMYPHTAALLGTTAIMLIVFVPTIFIGWQAYAESAHHMEVVQYKSESDGISVPQTPAQPINANMLYKRIIEKADGWVAHIKNSTGIVIPISPAQLLRRIAAWLSNLWPVVAETAIRMLIGLLIMMVALYYFLADGPRMINGFMRLSPMDKRHELELLARFAELSRSVVMATLLSALAQGILAGVGFYFALPSGTPIFLLTALTIILSIVPFIGAAAVWVPICLIILIFGEKVFVINGEVMEEGHWQMALILATYCTIFVSGIDNVIKPLVLRGQAHLHPLLALLSILGGVQVLGPVGILVGPILGSFLQALLAIFLKELHQWEDPKQRALTTLSPGAQALSEHITAAVEKVETHDANKIPNRTRGKKKKFTKEKKRQ